MATGLAAALSITAAMFAAPVAEATQLGPPPVEDIAPGSSVSANTVSVRPPRSMAATSGIDAGSVTSAVAPGLLLTQFDRLNAGGWIRGDVLTADLSEPGLKPEYLHAPSASQRTPLSEQAAAKHAVAGVNGDFFDVRSTGAPLGVGVDDGRVLNAPGGGHNQAAVVAGPQRVGGLMEVFLKAKITRADGSSVRATDLNAAKVSPG